jgi:hypothetical protein
MLTGSHRATGGDVVDSDHVVAFVSKRSSVDSNPRHSLVAIALARLGAVSDAIAIASVMLASRA